MNYRKLFLDNLAIINQVIRSVARRYYLSAADTEDFRSHVYEKLIENNYAILAKFGERSSLKTFLTTVITRLFLDYRIARWGKWRASAAARRLGPVAMRLEQLLAREGMTFDAAVETMRRNEGLVITDAELDEMRRHLSIRPRRREASESELEGLAAPEQPLDEQLDAEVYARLADRVNCAFKKVIEELDPQDRQLLRMRFVERLQIATIARVLGLEQKPLYPRLIQLFARLRQAFEAEGLTVDEMRDLFGRPDSDIGGVL